MPARPNRAFLYERPAPAAGFPELHLRFNLITVRLGKKGNIGVTGVYFAGMRSTGRNKIAVPLFVCMALAANRQLNLPFQHNPPLRCMRMLRQFSL